jgi:hypothetical protein
MRLNQGFIEEELKESINIFGAGVVYIFKRTTRLEETQEKTSRLHTFLTECHKLIQIAKRFFDFTTKLNTETLELWSLLVLLHNLKKTTVSRLYIYEQYLIYHQRTKTKPKTTFSSKKAQKMNKNSSVL